MHIARPPSAIDLARMLHLAVRLVLVAKAYAKGISMDAFETESEAADACEEFNSVEL